MSSVAFGVVAFMLTAYVLLDGYDLGVASVSLWVGRTDRERAAAMEAIGPFWNGNEVWLIAAGGALFALFPKAYASSFSGFYLPLVVVLWLLMFRGIAMELRRHYDNELWHQFWDVCFAIPSALLIVVFGVALGNLLRGVPLDERGYFQGTFAFLLNPYAVLVGLFALVTLAQHGAIFLAMRVEGEMTRRCRQLVRRIWWAVLVLYLAVSAGTFLVRGMPAAPWLLAMPAISLAALVAMIPLMHRERHAAAFGASSVFIGSLLVGAAGSLYPYIIPAYPLGAGGMSIFESSPSPLSIACALTVTLVGIGIVLIYGTLVTRRMLGKVRVE